MFNDLNIVFNHAQIILRKPKFVKLYNIINLINKTLSELILMLSLKFLFKNLIFIALFLQLRLTINNTDQG